MALSVRGSGGFLFTGIPRTLRGGAWDRLGGSPSALAAWEGPLGHQPAGLDCTPYGIGSEEP